MKKDEEVAPSRSNRRFVGVYVFERWILGIKENSERESRLGTVM